MDNTKIPAWLDFRPKHEIKSPTNTTIKGTVPKWLNGTLYRNGSGVFQVGETTMNHLFDGLAVLHKFSIADGDVKYQCRILDSETWEESFKANRLVHGQFGIRSVPDPCKNIFARMFNFFFTPEAMTDNTSVHVVPHGDKLLAMTETNKVNIVDPETLTRMETVDIANVVSVHLATAHPHLDTDGTSYNLGTCFNPRQAYNIIKIPPYPKDGGADPLTKATIVASLPSRFRANISYNHSFGMSENYFVILEHTLSINLLYLLTMKWTQSAFADCMTDYKDFETVIHVIRRTDGQRVNTTFTAKNFFCFHFINVYEESGHLVVDMVAFDGCDIVGELYLKNFRKGVNMSASTYRRFVLPLNTSKVECDKNLVTLSDTTATAVKRPDGSVFCTPDTITEVSYLELPRINYEKCNGKKHRFVYAVDLDETDAGIAELFKIDAVERKVLRWSAKDTRPGEPIFIAAPDAKEEDEGIILSSVMSDSLEDPSFLLILDAKTFEEIARAEIPAGAKIPMSFHGSFVAS